MGVELLLTDSGDLTKLQVGEILCSSKSACIQPANEVQLQLITLGKLEVGENQFAWFFNLGHCSGKMFILSLCIGVGFLGQFLGIFFPLFFYCCIFRRAET